MAKERERKKTNDVIEESATSNWSNIANGFDHSSFHTLLRSLTHLSFFSPSLFPVAFLCRRMFFLPKTRNEREIKRKEKKRDGLWGNLPIQIFFYFHLTVFGGKEKEKNKKKIKNNQKKSTKKHPPLFEGRESSFVVPITMYSLKHTASDLKTCMQLKKINKITKEYIKCTPEV